MRSRLSGAGVGLFKTIAKQRRLRRLAVVMNYLAAIAIGMFVIACCTQNPWTEVWQETYGE